MYRLFRTCTKIRLGGTQPSLTLSQTLRQGKRKERDLATVIPGPASHGGNAPERNFRYLLKPVLFTVAGSCTCFCGCAIWQYENHRRKALVTRKDFYLKKRKYPEWRQKLNYWWGSLGDKQVAAGIIAANCIVFALWRVPALSETMSRFFLASPFASRPCTSMLLSTFSHHSPLHLGINMYVMWSFAPPVIQLLGPEHFLFAYTSAGLVASLASYCLKVVRVCPTYSLGASGAIMGLLGMVCTHYPDAQLSIALIGNIFPHSFSAQNAMIGLIGIDSLGILLGWSMFDHAAHLGGMLFGIWYIKRGARQLWGRRHIVQKAWGSVRH